MLQNMSYNHACKSVCMTHDAIHTAYLLVQIGTMCRCQIIIIITTGAFSHLSGGKGGNIAVVISLQMNFFYTSLSSL